MSSDQSKYVTYLGVGLDGVEKRPSPAAARRADTIPMLNPTSFQASDIPVTLSTRKSVNDPRSPRALLDLEKSYLLRSTMRPVTA